MGLKREGGEWKLQDLKRTYTGLENKPGHTYSYRSEGVHKGLDDVGCARFFFLGRASVLRYSLG